jgi:hypothetical protein
MFPLVLVLLVGCGGTTRVVRLDTGRGEARVFTPRTAAEPVELDEDAFKEAVSALVRDMRAPSLPQEAARRLFEVEARSGSYVYEPHSHRLRSVDPGAHWTEARPEEEVELTRAYLRWCERTKRPGDCLRLLEEGPTLTGDGRYALAMAFAQGAVLDEMMDALEDMADPQAALTAVLWTCTTYMVLLSVPEPFSKGLAAVMTASLIAYVGVDTFWNLLVGFQRLVDEVDRAGSFDELRAAGERYGKVLGRDTARAFVMLATAALGNTAAGLGARVPTLPGAVQAAAQAESHVGFQLAAVGEVATVAMSTEAVTLTLASGAVAMAVRGPRGDDLGRQEGSSRAAVTPGDWVQVNESMSESARSYQFQVTGAPKGHVYRVKGSGEVADFDGFKDGVLLEAKGPHYEQFIDDALDFKGFFKGAGALLAQARRQFKVARGTPIRWVVAEEKLAAALRVLFREYKLKIEVVHVPPAP